MDRDQRWERVAKAYDAIVEAKGPRFPSADAVIADAYAHDLSDEFVLPAVVAGYRGIKDGDGVLCFNFRPDRVREILAALVDPAFSGFARPRAVRVAAAVGMPQYSEQQSTLLQTIIPPRELRDVLGQVVSDAGRAQLSIAETEKYAHVTYFLNGGEETPYPGEVPLAEKACQLLCEDHVGTYTLPYLCQWSDGTWRNVSTQEPVKTGVVGWRVKSAGIR